MEGSSARSASRQQGRQRLTLLSPPIWRLALVTLLLLLASATWSLPAVQAQTPPNCPPGYIPFVFAGADGTIFSTCAPEPQPDATRTRPPTQPDFITPTPFPTVTPRPTITPTATAVPATATTVTQTLASTSLAIRPPNTGDAGLRAGRGGTPLALLLAAPFALGAYVLRRSVTAGAG